MANVSLEHGNENDNETDAMRTQLDEQNKVIEWNRLVVQFLLAGTFGSSAVVVGVYVAMLSLTRASGIVIQFHMVELFVGWGISGIVTLAGILYWILRFYPKRNVDVIRPGRVSACTQ